jgi:hypothetical protein
LGAHVSDEQFNGIGANVYNGAPGRFHSRRNYKKSGDSIEAISTGCLSFGLLAGN